MKKIAGILFIIGTMFILIDVDNMAVFFATKFIGITMIIPAFLTIKYE